MNFKNTDQEPLDESDDQEQLSERNSVRVTWANQVNITIRFIALMMLIAFICWLLWGPR